MDIKFSDNDNRAYFQKIIGKLYKILPICEEHVDTKQEYIESLIRELTGSLRTISSQQYRVAIITVINTLAYLATAEFNSATFRSEIFKCIRIVGIVGGELHEV